MEFNGIQKQHGFYKDEIAAAVATVLEEGQFILGRQVQDLEKSLADFVGVKHCIAVSSGTDSLQIALMALGIGQGDEVITVPFTWISTAEAIAVIGATPVFVDIDPYTFLLDISQIESLITPRTKAIMPVSLFGQMADFSQLQGIAAKYRLAIIEDGAQSFGACQRGRMSCGNVAHIGSTSFFPTKPLGCYGDGGALFTDDDRLAEIMRAIRNHGSLNREDHLYLGINGRLDTLQAAILQVKMNYFRKEIEGRIKRAERYSHFLQHYVQVPKTLEGNTHIYAQYTIRTPLRDELMAALNKREIPARIYYTKCIHEQPAFAYLGYKKGSFPEAERAAKEVLSLPLHPWLTDEEQDLIISVLLDVFSYHAYV